MNGDLLFEKESYEDYLTVNGLKRITGLSTETKLLNLAIKELVDNALDASPPEQNIKIKIISDGHGISVRDYGSGLQGSPEEIADLFSITRSPLTTKAVRAPTRGMLGRGLRYVAGFVYNFNGRICVKTRNRILKFNPNRKRN